MQADLKGYFLFLIRLTRLSELHFRLTCSYFPKPLIEEIRLVIRFIIIIHHFISAIYSNNF